MCFMYERSDGAYMEKLIHEYYYYSTYYIIIATASYAAVTSNHAAWLVWRTN